MTEAEPGSAGEIAHEAADGRTGETVNAAAVVAVVVTYRRGALLARCVDAILGQSRPPDAVLVIDNDASARSALHDRPGVEVIEPGENLGPAGGYALGFGMALERGAARVWAVDDDVEPDPDCLERLLAASRGDDVVIPRQRKPGRGTSYSRTWNGPLIGAGVLRGVGLPRADLFFWAEDIEFFRRVRLGGHAIRPVPDAGVLHRNPERRRRGDASTWRLYYETRNVAHYRLRIARPTLGGVRRAMGVLVARPLAIVLFEPNKARSLRLWWWGTRDFARGRLGRVVDPETWEASARGARKASR